MKGLLFTYALTYGGAAASLLNPWSGLLIYISFAILKPESLWHWSVPIGNYSRVVAIALLIGWALNGFGHWSLGKARWIVFCFTALMAWSVLSAALAANVNIAFAAVEVIAKIFIPFLVGVTTIQTVRQLRQLAWVIVLSYGYLAFEANLSYLRDGINTVHLMGLPGMPDNNGAAIAFVTCLGFSFFMSLNNPSRWQKYLLLGISALMGHTILLSFSRGGILALIITGGVCLLLIPKQPRHYFVFTVAVLLALRFAGPEVRGRFATTFASPESRDYSAESRVGLWADCLDVATKRPFFGVGPDHWPLIAHEYGWTRGKEAHSLWMQTLAELGFPGLAFLACFYASCMFRLWCIRNGDGNIDPWFNDAARMVIASLTGFVVSAQFVTLEGLELPYYVVLLGAGALKLSDQIESGPEFEVSPGLPTDTAPMPSSAA